MLLTLSASLNCLYFFVQCWGLMNFLLLVSSLFSLCLYWWDFMAVVSDISRKIVLFTVNSRSSDSSSFYPPPPLPNHLWALGIGVVLLMYLLGLGYQAQHYFVFGEADLFISDKVITVWVKFILPKTHSNSKYAGSDWDNTHVVQKLTQMGVVRSSVASSANA